MGGGTLRRESSIKIMEKRAKMLNETRGMIVYSK